MYDAKCIDQIVLLIGGENDGEGWSANSKVYCKIITLKEFRSGDNLLIDEKPQVLSMTKYSKDAAKNSYCSQGGEKTGEGWSAWSWVHGVAVFTVAAVMFKILNDRLTLVIILKQIRRSIHAEYYNIYYHHFPFFSRKHLIKRCNISLVCSNFQAKIFGRRIIDLIWSFTISLVLL